MINWKSCKQVPELKKRIGNWNESAEILVWVVRENRAVIGKYYEYAKNDGSFKANGFNGDWEISHWSEIQSPNV